MKRSPLPLAAAILALAVLAAAAPQTAPEPAKKPDILGTWVGYAVAPGMRFELVAVFDKGEAGYTGKLSDTTGTLADTPLRAIAFKDGKLTFEFDLLMGTDPQLIKIELVLENETLKGNWFDSEGNSDVVELMLKK
ncbi:MAG TPA: hypothetical protein VLJ16_00855 [Acidobacteriota bacterium]|nr:hypothetical protein [Acidobacteriota bacterium]